MPYMTVVPERLACQLATSAWGTVAPLGTAGN
jgi:hypothetical protein